MRSPGIDAARLVLDDITLRRVLTGFATFSLAEHGGSLAVVLYAYQQGGVGEAGLVATALLLPAAIAAPWIAVIADWGRRIRVLVLGLATMGLLFGMVAIAMLGSAPALLTYAIAAVGVIALGFGRPAVASVLPSLARTPDSLTAANVMVGFVETIGRLVGPLAAGAILLVAGPGWIMAAFAAALVVGAAITATTRGTLPPSRIADDPAPLSASHEVMVGLKLLRRQRATRNLVFVITLTSVISGALVVTYAAIAVELLDRDEGFAGFLSAASGVGSLIGAALTLSLVGRRRLTGAIVASLVVAGITAAAAGASSAIVATVALLVVSGAGRNLAGVAGRTMLQSLAPDDTLARVFGVLEGLSMLALAVGAAAVSALAVQLSLESSLLVVGLLVAAVGIARWPVLASIDADRRVAAPDELALLRSVPMFAALPPFALEQLIASATEVRFDPGADIMVAGETGDTMYVVLDGTATVSTVTGLEVPCRRGSYVGEIALLNGTPRNATVVAGAGGLTAWAVQRDVFLEAISGVPRSHARAHAEARRRMDS